MMAADEGPLFRLAAELSARVLVSLAACSLVQIDDRNRDLSPAQKMAGFQPPLAGNQAALRRNDQRVTRTKR